LSQARKGYGRPPRRQDNWSGKRVRCLFSHRDTRLTCVALLPLRRRSTERESSAQPAPIFCSFPTFPPSHAHKGGWERARQGKATAPAAPPKHQKQLGARRFGSRCRYLSVRGRRCIGQERRLNHQWPARRVGRRMGHREEQRGLLLTQLRRGLGSTWPASLIGRRERLRRRSLRSGHRIGRRRTGIKARRGRRRDWLVGPQRLLDRPQGQRGQARLDDTF
jgi:hypothetical protein